MELFAEAGETDEGEAGYVEEEERGDAEISTAYVGEEGERAIGGGDDFQKRDDIGDWVVAFGYLGAALRGADKAGFDAEERFENGAGI